MGARRDGFCHYKGCGSVLFGEGEEAVVVDDGAVADEVAQAVDDGVGVVAGDGVDEGIDSDGAVGAEAREDGALQLLVGVVFKSCGGSADVAFAAWLCGFFAEIAQHGVDAAVGGAEGKLFHGCDALFHALSALLVDFDGDW